MLSTFAATRIAARLLSGPVQDLHAINDRLRELDLPAYYLGGAGFNVEYRIAAPPRYIWVWSEFGVKLAQFYLFHLPSVKGEFLPKPEDEIVIELR